MDEAAFNVLYQSSYHRIAALVYLMCGNVNEAEECTQEAFAVAWERRKQLRADDHPEAWIRTVARRVSIGRWRKARRLVSAAEPPEGLTHTPDAADKVAVHRALAELPVAIRETIVLHYFCDLSVADIAVETDSSQGTVKARLSRGRAKLSQVLGDGADAAVSASLREVSQPALTLPVPDLSEIQRRAGNHRRGRRVTVGIVGGGVVAAVCAAALLLPTAFPQLPWWQTTANATTITTPDPGGPPSTGPTPAPSTTPTTSTTTAPGGGIWDRVPTEDEVSAFEPGDLGAPEDHEGWDADLAPSVCQVDVPSLGATSVLIRTFTGAGDIRETAVVMEFDSSGDATAAREAIRYAYFNGCEPSGMVPDPSFLWFDAAPVPESAGLPDETRAEIHRVQWQGADQAASGFEDSVVVQVGNRLTWLVLHLGGVAEHECYAVDESGGPVCGIVNQIPAVGARLT